MYYQSNSNSFNTQNSCCSINLNNLINKRKRKEYVSGNVRAIIKKTVFLTVLPVPPYNFSDKAVPQNRFERIIVLHRKCLRGLFAELVFKP